VILPKNQHLLARARGILFVLAHMVLVPAAARAQPAATTTAPRTTLLSSPSTPLIAFRFVFRAGSQNDPPSKEGLAALTAAMVSQGGTESLTYDQVLAAFYPMASMLVDECHTEMTVFSGVVHRDNVRAYVPLATEMITRPRFAREDFERLRAEALDRVSKYLRANNDEELGKWALQVELYRDSPYGHPDVGTVQGLKAITLEDVKDFHRRHYTIAGLHVGIAGGFDEENQAEVLKRIGALPTAASPIPNLPEPRRPSGLDVTIIAKPADATAISMGFPIDVTRRDDDFYALAVANSYLGDHRTFNGKLMKEMRSERGLNYGDFSYIEDFIQEARTTFAVTNNARRQQYFSIWIRPVPADKAVFSLRAALWVLDGMLTHGLTQQEFEATRTYLLNYSKLWAQTASRRLGHAIDGEFYGRKDLITELAQRLPALTVEQVNAAVRKHLKSAGMKVVIVARDANGLREILRSGKPSPMSYDTQGTPEDVLAEDKQIAVFPLKDVTVRIVPVEQEFEK
jgi:zinc protease